MMRHAAYAVLAALALVVQLAWLARLPAWGGVADPLLPIVMTIGLLHGSEEGAVWGAAAGLLRDIMTGLPLGLGMLAGACVGFVAGLGRLTVDLENVWMPAVGAVLLALVSDAVWIGAAALVGLVSVPVPEIVRASLAGAGLTGVLAVPIFRGIRRLDGALARAAGRSGTA